ASTASVPVRGRSIRPRADRGSSPYEGQEIDHVLDPEDRAHGPPRGGANVVLGAAPVVRAVRVEEDLLVGIDDRLDEPRTGFQPVTLPAGLAVPVLALRLPALEPQHDVHGQRDVALADDEDVGVPSLRLRERRGRACRELAVAFEESAGRL